MINVLSGIITDVEQTEEERRVSNARIALMVPDSEKGLRIPIGLDLNESVLTVQLESNKSSSHMWLCGKCRSGKSNVVRFILKSLSGAYGAKAYVSCVTGKEVDMKQYYDALFTCEKPILPKFMYSCKSGDDLDVYLEFLIKAISTKRNHDPELLILSDIDQVIRLYPSGYAQMLAHLAAECTRKNIHILYVTEDISSLFNTQLRWASSFDLICATNLDKKESLRLFGSTLASNEGGSKVCGNITYKYGNAVGRLSVPDC